MIGVEIGQPEVRDLSFLTESGQNLQRIDITGVTIVPPVKLEQVDALDPEPFEPLGHACANHLLAHLSRLGTPLGADPHGKIGPARHQFACDQFGAAVVIGHVETVEAALGVVSKRTRRHRAIELRPASLHVGNLPQTGEQSRQLQTRGQFDTVRHDRTRAHDTPSATWMMGA